MREPFSVLVERLVHGALDEINACIAKGEVKGAPVTELERRAIVTNIEAVWPIWCQYQNAHSFLTLPRALDQASQLCIMKDFIDMRDASAAAILTRVLDDRLFLEIRRVRGTLGRVADARERGV